MFDTPLPFCERRSGKNERVTEGVSPRLSGIHTIVCYQLGKGSCRSSLNGIGSILLRERQQQIERERATVSRAAVPSSREGSLEYIDNVLFGSASQEKLDHFLVSLLGSKVQGRRVSSRGRIDVDPKA